MYAFFGAILILGAICSVVGLASKQNREDKEYVEAAKQNVWNVLKIFIILPAMLIVIIIICALVLASQAVR